MKNISFSAKLGSMFRHSVWMNYSDPTARDPNGYNQGSYYAAVYAWCPPGKKCGTNTTRFSINVDLLNGKN